jgi:hypothetical protein
MAWLFLDNIIESNELPNAHHHPPAEVKGAEEIVGSGRVHGDVRRAYQRRFNYY